ncbi:MAG: peptidase [Xanthomonadales bacterium]|nr:peptidase [Xanthomonadales bacterium]
MSLALAAGLALVACSDEPTPAPQASEPAAQSAPAPAKLQIDESSLPPYMQFAASDLDPAASACTDFNQYVNQRWLDSNPIPGDRTTWGSFEVLRERSLSVQKQIVEAAAGNPDASGTLKLVGDFWATGMDEAAIEAAGLSPIQPMLDEIDALSSPEQLVAYLRKSHGEGRGMVFGFGPESDFQDSTKVILYVLQGGLGLPDKGYYSGDEHAEAREAYQAHIAKLLTIAGADQAQAGAQAEAIMALESTLAEASYSSEEMSRDISKYYNPVSVSDADAITPAFSWGEFFAANGVEAPAQFSLSNPDFFAKLNELYGSVSMDDWKAYLRFHTIDGASPYLSNAYADQNFAFYGQALRGQKEQQARWKRVLDVVNGSVGEALGELYVEVAFPPESKAAMEKLVANLSAALKVRLENLAWMSPETKEKALAKWASFTPKIGYPDKWRDWSGLSTSRDSYVGNFFAAEAFNHRFQMAKVGKPKDKSEWGMTPQTINASYNPLQNEITFPAAILQPPFFDAEADDARNYGGIGAVIGHEMLHGYDDQGSRFDAQGSFSNWWQPSDAEGFKAKTEQLVDQFNGFEALPGKFVNGNLTLGENIADLGGLTVAYDALKRAQGADYKDPMIDGFTQDQRFFFNWAAVWRRNYTEKELGVRLVTDPHAPARFRAIAAPQNMPTFVAAFGCEDSDAMVRSGDDRIAIW